MGSYGEQVVEGMVGQADNRRSRRTALRAIAPAFFRDFRVTLIDVSTDGVGLQHDSPLRPGEQGNLEFTFDGSRVVLPCTVVYCDSTNGNRQFRSGLRIDADPNVRLTEFIRGVARLEQKTAEDAPSR